MASSEKSTEGTSKSSPARRKGGRPRAARPAASSAPEIEPASGARPARKARASTRSRSKAKATPAPAPAAAPTRAAERASAVAPAPAEPARAISATERHRMIAERAYLKAERRGFSGGSAERDWFEAASEVDALLIGRGTRAK